MPSSGDIRAGGAYVEVAAKDSLDVGLSAAQQKIVAFGQRISGIGNRIAAAGGGLAAIIGGPAAIGLAGKAMGFIREGITSAMEKSAVSAGRLRGAMEGLGLVGVDTGKTVRTAWDNAANVMFGMFNEIGNSLAETLMPMLTAAATRMILIARSILGWVNQNRDLVLWLFKIATAAAAAGAAISVFGKAMEVMAPLSARIRTAALLIGRGLGLVLSPIGLVVAAVAGIGTAALYFTGAWKPALQWFSDRFGWLGTLAKQVFGAISRALSGGNLTGAFAVVTTTIQYLWAEASAYLLTSFPGLYTGFWSAVSNIQAAWEYARNYLVSLWQYTVIDLQAIFQPFVDFWNGTVAWIWSFFGEKGEEGKSIWQTTMDYLGMATEVATGWITAAWDGVATAFQATVDWMSGYWGTVTDWMGSAWETFTGWVKSAWDSVYQYIAPVVEALATIFSGVIDVLRQIWDGFCVDGIVGAFIRAQAVIAKAIVTIISWLPRRVQEWLMGKEFDSEAVKKEIDADATRRIEGHKSTKQAASVEIEAARAGADEKARQAKEGRQAEIEAGRDQVANKAAADRDAAKRNLDEALKKANATRTDIPGMSELDLTGRSTGKGSAQGSFSAIAASMMGADGGAAEQTAKNTTEMVRLLKAMRREAYEQAGYTFA